MKRRDFIRRSALVSGTLFVPKFLTGANILANEKLSHRKVVIIQLSGGNDGLNTVVPYRNDIYYNARNTIALKENSLLKLTDEVGFHESLYNVKKMYDSGELTIVNNVGYPNPNRSHFRATDIWQTASDSNDYWQTGWVGRVLDEENRNPYHAIEVDDSLSLLMKGKHNNGVATRNPRLFYNTTREPYFKNLLAHYDDKHLSEHNLGYLYKTMIGAEQSANYLYQNTKTYNSVITYPDNAFGKQLKTIASFINSGLNTEIYYVSLGGFDTHANQVNTQKRLLKVYDEAIASFIKDLKTQGSFDDTLVFTFSEFGRRVKQNSANGTDHGAANNVFLMGGNLKKPGMYNDMPDLNKLDLNGDLQYSIDFRTIYASILNNWLSIDANKILKKEFNPLRFI